MAVSGVKVLLRVLEARSEVVLAMEADWLGRLKTDDAVLVWELAEPTPLSMSPCKDSVSSVEVEWWRASDVDRSGLARPSRWAADDADGGVGAVDAVLGSRSTASSDALDLARSRSVAFSRAARGAAGKNWAKPAAPDALGAILNGVVLLGSCCL